jgi:hypothetical protein
VNYRRVNRSSTDVLGVGIYELAFIVTGSAEPTEITKTNLESTLRAQFKRNDVNVLDWHYDKATRTMLIQLQIVKVSKSNSLEALPIVPIVITAAAILAVIVGAYVIAAKVERIVELVPEPAQIATSVGFGAFGLAALVLALAVFSRPVLKTFGFKQRTKGGAS